MNKAEKEKNILELLELKTPVTQIMKRLKVSFYLVDKVAGRHGIKTYVAEGKIHIGARFDKPLTRQVLAECERLGICRNDFLEMVTRKYIENKGL